LASDNARLKCGLRGGKSKKKKKKKKNDKWGRKQFEWDGSKNQKSKQWKTKAGDVLFRKKGRGALEPQAACSAR